MKFGIFDHLGLGGGNLIAPYDIAFRPGRDFPVARRAAELPAPTSSLGSCTAHAKAAEWYWPTP